MYHSVLPIPKDQLTVTGKQLDQQLGYLAARKYKSCFLDEIDHHRPLKERSVVLTFDDAYLNNYTNLIPLLEKYQMKATIMVPTGYLGQAAGWYDSSEMLMSVDQLKEIAGNPLIRLGLHTHKHINMRNTPLEDVLNDLKDSIAFFKSNGIEYSPVLAYPFGAYPKKKHNPQKHTNFVNMLKSLNIIYGLRIGNRLNSLPFKQPYEIKRVDIKGSDSLFQFKAKVTFGFINPF